MINSDSNVGHDATEQSPLLAARPDVLVAEIVAAVEEEDILDMKKSGRPISAMRGILILLSLGILVFMQTANVSLVTTIQSSIAAEFDAYTQVSWFNSAYLIAASSAPAIAGRLCELFTPQSYILASSMIFATGVLMVSMAPSLNWFLVGRAIAGLGTAGNFPVSVIIIIKMTSVKRRGLFMGLLNTGFTIGLALGAVIAGALEPLVGWRAVFWLQLPFILLAGVGLFFAMPPNDEAEKGSKRRASVSQKLASVDYLGILTLVAAVVLLLSSLSSPKITAAPIILSLVFLLAFLAVEAKHAKVPVIPITVLRSRGTLLTCIGALGMMASRYLVILYSPVYFMTAQAWSPVHAGLSLIAVNGGFAVGGLMVGWIHIRRAGSYYMATLVTFTLFTVVYYLTSALSTRTTPAPVYLALLFINGAATGSSLNYTLVHLLHLTPISYHSIATSVTAMFRGFGGSFGSAIGGGIFLRILRGALERGFDEQGIVGKDELIRQLLGSPRLVGSLMGVEKTVATDAYTAAIRGLFFAGASLALAAVICQAGTGWRAPQTRIGDGLSDNAEDVTRDYD